MIKNRERGSIFYDIDRLSAESFQTLAPRNTLIGLYVGDGGTMAVQLCSHVAKCDLNCAPNLLLFCCSAAKLSVW